MKKRPITYLAFYLIYWCTYPIFTTIIFCPNKLISRLNISQHNPFKKYLSYNLNKFAMSNTITPVIAVHKVLNPSAAPSINHKSWMNRYTKYLFRLSFERFAVHIVSSPYLSSPIRNIDKRSAVPNSDSYISIKITVQLFEDHLSSDKTIHCPHNLEMALFK